MRTAWTTIAQTLRSLRRDPALLLLAVLSIGVGVGANAAVFSLAEQALFRLLPVREPERLALLSWKGDFVGDGWGSGNLLSYPLYKELSEENDVFEAMFCRHPTTVHFAAGDAAEEVSAAIVSGTYFPALGVRPALGRLLEPADDRDPGAHPVVVVSFDFWRNRLGGNPDVVGRRVFVNSHPMIIVGVAPAGFHGVDWGEAPALWIPTMMKRQATPSWDRLFDRRARWLHVFGRLKPGVSFEEAEARIQPWFKAMLAADTEREGWPQITEERERRFLASTLEVLPGARGRSDLRGDLEQPLWVLLGATALVLLLACLNVANLSLARALARAKETALRSALGASRARIARERLVESGLLALGGGLLGLLLAPNVAQTLLAFLPSDVGGVGLSPELNFRVTVFALAVTVFTAVLAGLAPALYSSAVRPAAALKEQASTAAGGLLLRKVLVVGQISLALILMVGAGLFGRTLASLRSQGPGFETTNLMTFHLDLLSSGYMRPEAKSAISRILDTVRSLPEVESAGLASTELLTGGSWNTTITVASDRRFVTDDYIHCNRVSPGFFDTLGAPIIAGRGFTEQDALPEGEKGVRSAIINERFAENYFGDGSPLGARLGLGSDLDTPANIEIVGVVKTFHYRGLRQAEEQAFFPYFESSGGGATFYVRTHSSSSAAAGALRTAVRSVDPALPVSGLRTLDARLDRVLVTERMLAVLAAAFGLIATFLAVLGLYGVTSFVAARRTREIGIRIALGASRSSAQGLVVRDSAVLVAVGLLIAVPVVAALGRLVQSQLFGVQALDALTICGAASVVAAASLAAAAVPARRASAVNPAQALRNE